MGGVCRLLRMKHRKGLQRGIVIELNERRATRVTLATEGEQHRAIRRILPQRLRRPRNLGGAVKMPSSVTLRLMISVP